MPYCIDSEKRTSWRKPVKQRYGNIFDKLYYDGGIRYEAEAAELKDIKAIRKLNISSKGKDVSMSSGKGSAVIFRDIDAGFAGDKIIYIRYYNGDEAAAEQNLIVNGRKIRKIVFPKTGGWRKLCINDLHIPVALNQEINTIRLESLKNTVAIDFIQIVASEDYRLTLDAQITSGGIYQIENKHNGLSLSIKNKGRKIESPAVVSRFKGEPHQKFRLTYCDYGFYKFTPIHIQDLSRALNVLGFVKRSGSEIGLLESQRTPRQKWAVIPLSNGYYKIVNKFSGKCSGNLMEATGSNGNLTS